MCVAIISQGKKANTNNVGLALQSPFTKWHQRNKAVIKEITLASYHFKENFPAVRLWKEAGEDRSEMHNVCELAGMRQSMILNPCSWFCLQPGCFRVKWQVPNKVNERKRKSEFCRQPSIGSQKFSCCQPSHQPCSLCHHHWIWILQKGCLIDTIRCGRHLHNSSISWLWETLG